MSPPRQNQAGNDLSLRDISISSKRSFDLCRLECMSRRGIERYAPNAAAALSQQERMPISRSSHSR